MAPQAFTARWQQPSETRSPLAGPSSFKAQLAASLKPGASTPITLLRQADGSYTAFELTDTSLYRIFRATLDFQKQFTACPGPLLSGTLPSLQRRELFTPLSSGGWLKRVMASTISLPPTLMPPTSTMTASRTSCDPTNKDPIQPCAGLNPHEGLLLLFGSVAW